MDEGILIISLIVWIASGFICMAIFRSKGRSGLGGFATGFLLSILGIVVAAFVIKPTEAKEEERKLKNGEGKRCPHCTEIIKSEAVVCKHCGQPVPLIKPSIAV